MSFISEGIDKVRAFVVPSGFGKTDLHGVEPGSAIVKWVSSNNDKLHQIYVNGNLAAVTSCKGQYQILLSLRKQWGNNFRIEIGAVDCVDAYEDFSDELDMEPAVSGRMRISFLRSLNLPYEATFAVYNSISGEIDFDTDILEQGLRIWPSVHDNCGFGLACFGEADFGYDCQAAVGFGVGVFGIEQFGFGEDMIDWVSAELENGSHNFALRIRDRFGNEDESPGIGNNFVLTKSAEPAAGLGIGEFNAENNQLDLKIID